MKAHIGFVFDEEVNWLRQIHIGRGLNGASITCRTAGSLIAGIRGRIKGHGRGSIRARHDVVVDVAVDVAVAVDVTVDVAVVVS